MTIHNDETDRFATDHFDDDSFDIAGSQLSYDVIVVGAGLSGLCAADVLTERDRKVLVLEASEQIGGRIRTEHRTDGTVAELGPSYIGPTQRHMQALVRRFGLTEVRAQFSENQHSLNLLQLPLGRMTSSFTGNGTHSNFGKIDKAISFIDALTADTASNLDEPWKLEKELRENDSWTVQEWMDRELTSKRFGTLAFIMRQMLAIFVRNILSAEPRELSMLFFMNYCARCGGFKYLTSAVDYGPDCIRIAEGMDRFAIGLRDSIENNGGRVLTGTPVTHIVDDPSRAIEVICNEGTFRCKQVIVATPPHASAAIAYTPALPSDRIALCEGMKMGKMYKGFVHYRSPWFTSIPSLVPTSRFDLRTPRGSSRSIRALHGIQRFLGGGKSQSYSGYTIADSGPICWTMNGSWPNADGGQKNAALMFFVVGDAYDELVALSPAQRQQRIEQTMVSTFPLATQTPEVIDYQEMDWSKDPLARGGPTATTAPGTLSRYGHTLRHPHGRVHWAGTEAAVHWGGYLEGALDAGIRAAQQVDHVLSGGDSLRPFWPEL